MTDHIVTIDMLIDMVFYIQGAYTRTYIKSPVEFEYI
jgi:hypothetical protein